MSKGNNWCGGTGFALLVVLFILLIIVGAAWC
ncbi:YjcZ family sporulation protein [Cytobacillus solani]|nr:YjcZ family sporulation protein [Cytobacillus solani]USK53584.1 YjcZ family sporulation protein [Cytobacillus solani]